MKLGGAGWGWLLMVEFCGQVSTELLSFWGWAWAVSVYTFTDKGKKITPGGSKKSQEWFAMSEQKEILWEIKFVSPGGVTVVNSHCQRWRGGRPRLASFDSNRRQFLGPPTPFLLSFDAAVYILLFPVTCNGCVKTLLLLITSGGTILCCGKNGEKFTSFGVTNSFTL